MKRGLFVLVPIFIVLASMGTAFSQTTPAYSVYGVVMNGSQTVANAAVTLQDKTDTTTVNTSSSSLGGYTCSILLGSHSGHSMLLSARKQIGLNWYAGGVSYYGSSSGCDQESLYISPLVLQPLPSLAFSISPLAISNNAVYPSNGSVYTLAYPGTVEEMVSVSLEVCFDPQLLECTNLTPLPPFNDSYDFIIDNQFG